MEEETNFIEAYLEAYSLMHRYNMIWYMKNFCGLDPWQGQGRILSALSTHQNMTQKQLGLTLKLRPQSLGELLHKLESNGYIKRYRSPTDKRALIVELTEKGEIFQRKKPEYEKVFADLTQWERDCLKKSMEKISVRLAEFTKREIDTFYEW